MSTVLERPAARTTRLRTGITFPDYDRLQGVNWSTLGAMHTSALEYREKLLHPKVPTPTMVLGSAIHCAVLEPDLFDQEYVLYEGTKTGNAWEEVKASAESEGLTILSPEQWEQCMGAAWAVHRGRQGREARRIMRGSKREVVFQWVDPDTHIRCKARPDIVGRNVLADVKTTTTVDERKFGRLAGDMLYHGKMALARMGLDAIGHPVYRVAIIAVEQSAPHDVGVFDIDAAALYSSEEMVCGLLQKLKKCRRTRSWPGRCENTQILDLPPWAPGMDPIDYEDATESTAPAEGFV